MINDDFIIERQKRLEDRKEFPLFRNFILYSEIKAQLDRIQADNCDIMKVEEIGQSALGKPLYCVFVSDKDGLSNLDQIRDGIKSSMKDPKKSLEELNKNPDSFKAIVFVNCSTHGTEICGTDAGLKVLRYLTSNKSTDYVKKILKHLIIIINISANPDGRWLNCLYNGNNIDLNRDSMTSSQPEIKCLNDKIRFVYFPNSTVDVHGYWGDNTGIFDCCTEPHNPNCEYMLQEKMVEEAGLFNRDCIKKQLNLNIIIPSIDYKNQGWDDYTPVFNSSINAMTGGLGHTLEVNYANSEGIEMAFISILSNLIFVTENKVRYLELQFKTYLNGVLSNQSAIEFPKYYLIPLGKGLQKNSYNAMEIINKLLDFKVEVHVNSEAFNYLGVEYAVNSTYIIKMNQALRGIANNILWEGEDITEKVITLYDISVFSLKLFYNVNVIPVYSDIKAKLYLLTNKLKKKAEIKKISIYLEDLEKSIHEGGISKTTKSRSHYAFLYKNNEAVKYITKLNKFLSKSETPNKHYDIKNIEGKQYFIVRKTANSNYFIEKHFPYTDWFEIDNSALKRFESNCKVTSLNIIYSFKPNIRYVYVGDNGACYLYLKSLGYDITAVSLEMLNGGFELRQEEFDGLIINGIQAFYQDKYLDILGTSWGQSYGLHRRSKETILSFAKNVKYLLGCGYSGAAFVKELFSEVKFEFNYFKDINNVQSMNNGVFQLKLEQGDVLSSSYEEKENFFSYLPVWYQVNSDDWIISGKYLSFYKGFCNDKDLIKDKPAIIRNNPRVNLNVVLIGFDPAFRLYNSSSFRLLYNSMIYFDSLSY